MRKFIPYALCFRCSVEQQKIKGTACSRNALIAEEDGFCSGNLPLTLFKPDAQRKHLSGSARHETRRTSFHDGAVTASPIIPSSFNLFIHVYMHRASRCRLLVWRIFHKKTWAK